MVFLMTTRVPLAPKGRTRVPTPCHAGPRSCESSASSNARHSPRFLTINNSFSRRFRDCRNQGASPTA